MSGSKTNIGLRNISSLRAGQAIWDGSVSGLAARRQASSVVSYIVMCRTTAGRKRTYTIGKPGPPWMPETARQEARRILGGVAKDADPMADKIAWRKAFTVALLCRQYLTDVEAGRLLTRRQIAEMESTLISDRGRITRHIIPLLGRKSVASITRNDVEEFMHDVAAGRPAGRRPSHAVSPSCAAAVVSLDALWHCSARSSPMPFAMDFGSTIRRMVSSNLPLADGNGG
jgi:hypothetical protein